MGWNTEKSPLIICQKSWASVGGKKKDSLVLSVWDPITDGVFVLNLCTIEISKNRNELKSAEDKVEK